MLDRLVGVWLISSILVLIDGTQAANPPLIVDAATFMDLRSPRSVGEHIVLPVHENAVVRLRITQSEMVTADRFTIAGRSEEGDDSSFVLAVNDGQLMGACWLADGRTFDLRSEPGRPDRMRVSEVSPEGCGPCSCNNSHSISDARPPDLIGDSSLLGPTCEPVIDVLILYTDLARDMLGSDAAMHAHAAASVASANLTYANSGVPQRLRLAGVENIAGDETGDYGLELIRLVSPADTHYDTALPLRNRYGADLVSLFVGTVTGSCGVAFIMSTPSSNFEASAYSVVQQNCAITNLSFVHELGHNMGCAHQHGDGSNGSFPYSRGHRFVGQTGTQWRTVMAGSSGFRVPYFSNPDVLYDAVPTGIPVDQPLPGNNALSLTQTAAAVSQFRDAVVIDCNGNGTDDSCDIQLGFSDDANTNGVPDECDAPACATDDDITITAPDLTSFDRFGGSISLASERIVIGSEQDDDAGTFSGSAYVYRREGESWVIEDKLRALDAAAFDRFGHAVTISPDESWIVIGAYREGDILSDTGAIYFFHRTNENWMETQRIINPDPAQADWFGWTVALSGSGENLRAVIGAPNDDEAAPDCGAVYAYRLEGSTWLLEQKMTSTAPSIGARLGYALHVSNGSRVIAGAPFEDGADVDTGAVDIFRRDGQGWTHEDRLSAPNAAANDRFGISVTLTNAHAIAGASGDDERGDRAGAAHTFARRGERWVHIGKLFAADAEPLASFGVAGAMRENIAVIGATFSESNGAVSGAAYLFARDGDVWLPRAKFNPRDAAPSDGLGAVVALSSDASLAAAASIFDDAQGVVDGGSVRLFAADLDQPDCNGNGWPDACDVNAGVSMDVDANGQPDECEPIDSCPTDFDGSGLVDSADLLTVINAWGACGTQPDPCDGDTMPPPVGNGVVNVDDLLAAINAWGDCS